MTDLATNIAQLREAAGLMRLRAKSAANWDGNWEVHPSRPGRVIEVKGDGWDDAIVASCVDYGGTENGFDTAPHIASWSPPVALAIAGWLDTAADWREDNPEDAAEEPDPSIGDPALTVARAYLGRDA